jgi:iron complex transport system ATP-binding protein
MTLLSVHDLSVMRGECPVVDQVSFSVSAGEFIGLIGPNGAGKTTFMRAALGLLPHTGTSTVSSLSARDRARSAAWMPQNREIAWAMSVRDVVALGRLTQNNPAQDDTAIASAIARMGLVGFETRSAIQLSGGEQARVLIARALAQDTPLLMADEPTASLDPESQLATMDVFRGLAADGHGVVASIHDLGLAARSCTKLALMHRGKLVAFGTPSDVLTQDNLRNVFRINAYYTQTEHGAVFQPLSVISD